ncbi:DUF4148 domain-containing protein [Paraburkholderia sp. GAS334]|uniref:DUF4148 domain-containing protein n=1 Tax=Paraburkholderia sp. GAS334 TaxID=3035131 RepID=UPI003D2535B1
MKGLISSLVVAGALIVPAVSFAQTGNNDPITRDSVRAQVVQAEQQGVLHQSKTHYPQYDTPAHAMASGVASTGNVASNVDYGPATYGSTQSGQPATLPHYAVSHSIYSGH